MILLKNKLMKVLILILNLIVYYNQVIVLHSRVLLINHKIMLIIILVFLKNRKKILYSIYLMKYYTEIINNYVFRLLIKLNNLQNLKIKRSIY